MLPSARAVKLVSSPFNRSLSSMNSLSDENVAEVLKDCDAIFVFSPDFFELRKPLS